MDNRCFICGEDNPSVLQQHHAVPRRYGGEDTEANLYWLCANCHQAVEKIYNDKFYQKIGVKKRKPTPGVSTLPPEFIDDCLERSDGWVEKEKLRKTYAKYTREHGYEEMHPGALGRALTSLTDWSISPSQPRDPNGQGRLQVYKGVALTDTARQLLEDR